MRAGQARDQLGMGKAGLVLRRAVEMDDDVLVARRGRCSIHETLRQFRRDPRRIANVLTP